MTNTMSESKFRRLLADCTDIQAQTFEGWTIDPDLAVEAWKAEPDRRWFEADSDTCTDDEAIALRFVMEEGPWWVGPNADTI